MHLGFIEVNQWFDLRAQFAICVFFFWCVDGELWDFLKVLMEDSSHGGSCGEPGCLEWAGSDYQ